MYKNNLITVEFIQKDEFYDWLKSLKHQITKVDRDFLSDMRISVLYNCNLLALKDESGTIISFLSYTVTNNYLNIYFMYTVPEKRNKNHSTELIDYALFNETKFIARIYVKASTIQSVAFFKSKEFAYQGQDKTGACLFEQEILPIVQKRKSDKFVIDGTQNKVLKDLLKLPPFNCNSDTLKKYRIYE